jgi:hypothetical protein
MSVPVKLLPPLMITIAGRGSVAAPGDGEPDARLSGSIRSGVSNVHQMRALSVGLVLILSGCSLPGDKTIGEKGSVLFYYSSGSGCFFGCGLDKPMMRGTAERLFAKGASSIRAASYSVEPTNLVMVTDALSFEDNGSAYRAFDLSALGVGDARFSLMSENGALIDRVMLRIRDAARLSAEWASYNENHSPTESDWSSSAVIPLSGNDVYVRVSAFDGNGQQLQAASGITVKVSDERVVVVKSSETEGAWLVLHPLSPGSAIMTATSESGVSTQLSIMVH